MQTPEEQKVREEGGAGEEEPPPPCSGATGADTRGRQGGGAGEKNHHCPATTGARQGMKGVEGQVYRGVGCWVYSNPWPLPATSEHSQSLQMDTLHVGS